MAVSNPKYIGFIVVISNIFNAMAINIYLPSLPSLQKHFLTTPDKTQLIIVVFYFGAVVSRLFWGPFSDIIGRKKAILTAYSLQAFFQIMCVFASSMEDLIIFRVLQSLGSGVTGVIGVAIIADCYTGHERAKMLNFVELSFTTAFIIAPMIGIFLHSLYGWQGGFVFIFISYIFSFVLYFHFLSPDKSTKKRLTSAHIFKNMIVIYQTSFNSKMLKFSFISGLGAGIFMGFMLKSPFIYLSKFGISNFQYVIFQTIPFIINFLVSIFYKKIIDKVSIDNSISQAIFYLIILSIISLGFTTKIIEFTSYTYFFMMCALSILLPFLISGGVTLALQDCLNKGMGASINASIRSLCLSSIMYSVTQISVDINIFYILPLSTIFFVIVWHGKCSTK